MCQLCCNCSSFAAVAACQDELQQQQLCLRVKGREERKKGRKGRKAVKEDKEHSVCKFMANRRNQCGQKKKEGGAEKRAGIRPTNEYKVQSTGMKKGSSSSSSVGKQAGSRQQCWQVLKKERGR